MSRDGDYSDTGIGNTDITDFRAVSDGATVVSFTFGFVLVIAALVHVTHE